MLQQEEDVCLDLEKRLMDDTGGDLQRELEAYLRSYQERVRHHLDSGLPPEAFAQFQTIDEAIARASEVLSRAWALWHS